MADRRLVPGRRDYDGGTARALPDCVCHMLPVGCNQGRLCPLCETELANTHAPRVELVRSVPSRPPIRMQRYPTPRIKRAKRFFRDLVAFLTAARFRP